MRSVTRQSARLARCTTSSAKTARRCFCASHTFRSTPDPRPPYPGAASDSQQNLTEEDNHSHSPQVPAHIEGSVHHPRAVAARHDEDESQATSSSTTADSKPRLTLRQRRLAEVPRPPPIPEWFLKQNVLLLSESYAMRTDRESPKAETRDVEGSRTGIECRERETGQVLFTVPPYNESLSRGGVGGNAAAIEADVAQMDHSTWLEPMMWILLEAELSICAALSLPISQQLQYSFASSRTDLSLVCPDDKSHLELDLLVKELALTADADLIRIDANDLEDLTGDFVGSGRDIPSSFSTLGYDVFDGYAASDGQSLHSRLRKEYGNEQDMEEDEFDEEEEEDEDNDIDISSTPGLSDTLKKLGLFPGQFKTSIKGFAVIPASQLGGAGFDLMNGTRKSARGNRADTTNSPEFVQWDDAKLWALLDSLIEAPREKQQRLHQSQASESEARLKSSSKTQLGAAGYSHRDVMHSLVHAQALPEVPASRTFQRFWGRPLGLSGQPRISRYRSAIAAALFGQETNYGKYFPVEAVSFDPVDAPSSDTSTATSSKGTIIHLRDLKDICRTPLGENIVRRFVRVVQKRRRKGEQIMIIGTSAQSGLGKWANEIVEDSPFRTLIVPPYFSFANKNLPQFADVPWSSTLTEPTDERILDINLRHLQSMLRRMWPDSELELSQDSSRALLAHGGTRFLSERVLPLDDVQRLLLLAVGLSKIYAVADSISPLHIGLACFITSRVDQIARVWTEDGIKDKSPRPETKATSKPEDAKKKEPESASDSKFEKLRESCNPHELRLLGGVVNPKNIRTGFDDIHVSPDTVEALKTLTELALLRPREFEYGVLAKDRLPGLLLYGPPGTGKTLLAKAVAQRSSSVVLEVTGAQIFEKYVGEGEKMVRAVFSLARKLSPCVVFIDEADSIFASRSDFHARNSHRAIINQFLREWDGMDDRGVFIMVATNRPFDLDDAVLRRLPRRLLVDLPVTADREKILAIHLNGEQLDSSVSLSRIAEQTPLYSGSDLKNLCVAAALACVREENKAYLDRRQQGPSESKQELPSSSNPDQRRILSVRHFDKALTEISASISEDMVTLSAIRKFDERYGDRKGRRKKTRYGFGGDGADESTVDENSVRVRQATPLPSPIVSSSSPATSSEGVSRPAPDATEAHGKKNEKNYDASVASELKSSQGPKGR